MQIKVCEQKQYNIRRMSCEQTWCASGWFKVAFFSIEFTGTKILFCIQNREEEFEKSIKQTKKNNIIIKKYVSEGCKN